MIIQSKYTKTFHSKDLTRQKYDELYDFAVLIRSHKNTVSQYVNDNLLHFLEYNKLLNLRNLNVRRLKKYYYRFGETYKKRQGVNVKKVV